MRNMKTEKELRKEVCKGDLEVLRERYNQLVEKANYEQLRILWILAKNIIK